MNTYLFDLSLSQLEDTYIDTLDEDVINHLKKMGRIHYCTSLRNLKLRRSSLKTLSNDLSNDISENVPCNDITISYNTVINLLNYTSSNPILKISVEKYQNRRLCGNIYEAVFFTWRTSTDNEPTGDVNLPYLYCTGRQQFIKLINGLIEKRFSCTITAVIFPQTEMKWLTVLTLQCIAETAKDIQLTYEVEWGRTKFTFYLPFEVLKSNWTRIHDDDSSKINYEEVALFHSSLEEHVINSIGIDLSQSHLKTIAIPGYVVMDVSGKIQVSNVEILDVLYRFLTDRKTSS